MEGEVGQMQADMQALVEADLDAQQVHLHRCMEVVYQALKHNTLVVLQQNDSCTGSPATAVEGPRVFPSSDICLCYTLCRILIRPQSIACMRSSWLLVHQVLIAP